MAKNQITPFGQRVKDALKQKGMTQGDLAEKLGITKQYLYNILYGKRPGMNYLAMIAEICEIDMDDMENDTAGTDKAGNPCEDLFEKNKEAGEETGRDIKKKPKKGKSKREKTEEKKQVETHEFTPFGVRVSEALDRMGIKQVELAREIGTSKQYLYMILHGQRSGAKYLEKIALICGIELEVLLNLKQRKQTTNLATH